MESKKPDGWVAWHPDTALRTICRSENAARRWLNQTLHRPDEKGWRIRPVKLVFLDEESNDE